jgi:hypothetical protein
MSSVVLAHLRALLKAGADNGGFCHWCHRHLEWQEPHDQDCAYKLAVEFVSGVDGG